jgi:pyruvate dehydrogenase E2 component (dihydrolipoamide acetyltransferase)
MKFSPCCVLLLALRASETHAFAPFAPSAAGRLSLTELHAEGSKITMPALSSTMKEGKVVSWLKSEGEQIEAGEAIMVVESDKADMDVEAFEDGFLAKIIVGEGEMAPVGEAVALIAESEDDIASVVAGFEGGSAPAPVDTAPDAAPVEGESRDESLRYCARESVVWIMSGSSPVFLNG